MDIKSIIPHREPFLYVDHVTHCENNSIQTEKAITGEEDFLKGHFPGNPIVPGVIMTEALLQSGALLMGQHGDAMGKTPVVTRVQNIKFKNIVRPPATLHMEVNLVESVDHVSFFRGKIKVDGKMAVSCEFACALVDG
jgi:3-hydroxyacyl-[acyl-carrier-protein] dehydratase